MTYKLHNDDCINALKSYPDNYFDSIVTDPPSGISFMGKDWDHDKGGRDKWIEWMTEVASECIRVLKPGGHALVWALPRTSHWTATAWEDAGFEVRDRVAHVFGSGFPKSYNIAKGVEGILTNGSASWNDFHKLNGNKGDENSRGANGMVKLSKDHGNRPTQYSSHGTLDLEPTTEEAKQWEGWGTALKPAMEDWWLLRKPCSEKTVAANVLKWGTGALNIDACRIPGESIPINKLPEWSGFGQIEKPEYEQEVSDKGRWPAQFIHDGSEEVVSMFPITKAAGKASGASLGKMGQNGKYNSASGENMGEPAFYGDEGSAARFFYCAKPSKAERNEGLEGRSMDEGRKEGNPGGDNPRNRGLNKRQNSHPTVKSQALMQYLITLITPQNGTVLDCFMGSGTTGVAAVKLGFNFVGIESDVKYGYMEIAERRMKHATIQERLL